MRCLTGSSSSKLIKKTKILWIDIAVFVMMQGKHQPKIKSLLQEQSHSDLDRSLTSPLHVSLGCRCVRKHLVWIIAGVTASVRAAPSDLPQTSDYYHFSWLQNVPINPLVVKATNNHNRKSVKNLLASSLEQECNVNKATAHLAWLAMILNYVSCHKHRRACEEQIRINY